MRLATGEWGLANGDWGAQSELRAGPHPREDRHDSTGQQQDRMARGKGHGNGQ